MTRPKVWPPAPGHREQVSGGFRGLFSMDEATEQALTISFRISQPKAGRSDRDRYPVAAMLYEVHPSGTPDPTLVEVGHGDYPSIRAACNGLARDIESRLLAHFAARPVRGAPLVASSSLTAQASQHAPDEYSAIGYVGTAAKSESQNLDIRRAWKLIRIFANTNGCDRCLIVDRDGSTAVEWIHGRIELPPELYGRKLLKSGAKSEDKPENGYGMLEPLKDPTA